MPSALVTAVMAGGLVPAPVDGEVKVTGTPITGLPLASLTITCNGVANDEPTDVYCAAPLTTVKAAGVEAPTVKQPVVPSINALAASVAVRIALPAVFSVALKVPT